MYLEWFLSMMIFFSDAQRPSFFVYKYIYMIRAEWKTKDAQYQAI